MQGKPLRGLIRTENHDRFGLAVLIYQLLFVGRHPCAGVYRGAGDPSFEELIADILKDFGFDTELTKATRDGGRDIYAYVKNAVTSFLMFVECKKWAHHNKVGIDVVQRVHGAAKAGGAHKAMIVTTSFFTLPAQKEHRRIDKELDLADYETLKTWLAHYKSGLT